MYDSSNWQAPFAYSNNLSREATNSSYLKRLQTQSRSNTYLEGFYNTNANNYTNRTSSSKIKEKQNQIYLNQNQSTFDSYTPYPNNNTLIKFPFKHHFRNSVELTSSPNSRDTTLNSARVSFKLNNLYFAYY